jgi:Predicted membrane protein
MPLRAAAICGLLAPVTFIVGVLLGDLAQSDAFSPADDNISDLGAQTAEQAWLYNQIASNLNGLLIVAFGLGLWQAVGSGLLARLGVLGLIGIGLTRLLEGFLRLDCGGMDEVCENTSWQAEGHRIETGVTSVLLFLVPPVLAFAFRRLPQWRDLWIPTLLVLPVVIGVSIPFSVIGNGASQRAGSIVWFLWLGLIAWRLKRIADDRERRGPSQPLVT